MSEAVNEYLAALHAQDWQRLGGTLAGDDFERVGPFCDVIASVDEYVAFLERVVPGMKDYRVVVRRMVEAGPTVYVETTESFEHEGETMELPEVLVFDTDQGAITRVQVYMMRPGGEPAVAGGRA
jgi:limonene-1,2-epoxide hydrolase